MESAALGESLGIPLADPVAEIWRAVDARDGVILLTGASPVSRRRLAAQFVES
ncbi:MAG: hypothetical protein JO326_03690, partial [Acetobacteraceae bacterium]|nr:hypothetical protein [Acetobacteraceae bacterium]